MSNGNGTSLNEHTIEIIRHPEPLRKYDQLNEYARELQLRYPHPHFVTDAQERGFNNIYGDRIECLVSGSIADIKPPKSLVYSAYVVSNNRPQLILGCFHPLTNPTAAMAWVDEDMVDIFIEAGSKFHWGGVTGRLTVKELHVISRPKR